MSVDRQYGVIEGISTKAPCICATTANITLYGTQTIDGVSVVAGQRVLVKDQTDQTTNGIYLVDSATWKRALDFDGPFDIVSGTTVFVAQGTTNIKSFWEVSTADPITIGGATPSNITFTQIFTTVLSSITAAPLKNPPIAADWLSIVDSVTGLINKLTFTNLAAYLATLTGTWALSTTGNAATATSATSATNATNVTGYTANVASGGAAVDIWTGTGNVVQFTGTGTTTGFANAPAAGAQRKLICSGACLFTTGANLIIEGFQSGATVTLAANAIVDVLAVSTTQFKLTYSVSGAFTATGTGFTTTVQASASFSIVNGICSVFITQSGLTGTSNATTFTVTGLPACCAPVTAKVLSLVYASDNSATTQATPIINAGAAIITLGKGLGNNAWTAANGKQLGTSEFVYSLS